MSNNREEWNRLTLILNAASIAVSGCGVPVDKTGIVHGAIVWDECCEGYLFLRVIQTNVTNPFPQPSETPTTCVRILGTQVEIGILRCAPMMDDNGNPPSDAVQSAFAYEMIVDKSILYNVLVNHNPDWAAYPLVIGSWNPLDIEGGCGGGTWSFWIDVTLCDCGPTN